MRKLYTSIFTLLLLLIAAPSFAASVDLSITITDSSTTKVPGAAQTFTIAVTNSGPGDATNASIRFYPAGNLGVTWTCTPDAGSACAASGVDFIEDATADIQNGDTITYSVTTTANQCAAGDIVNSATVTADAADTDTDLTDNAGSDTTTLTPRNLSCVDGEIHMNRGIGTVTNGCTRELEPDAVPYAETGVINCPFEDGVDKCFTIQTATPNNLGAEVEFRVGWESLAAGNACLDLWATVIPTDVVNFVFPTDIDYATDPQIIRRAFTASTDDLKVYDIFTLDYVDSPFWKAEQADDCGDPTEARCKSAILIYKICRNNTTTQCTTAGGGVADSIRINVLLPDYLPD